MEPRWSHPRISDPDHFSTTLATAELAGIAEGSFFGRCGGRLFGNLWGRFRLVVGIGLSQIGSWWAQKGCCTRVVLGCGGHRCPRQASPCCGSESCAQLALPARRAASPRGVCQAPPPSFSSPSVVARGRGVAKYRVWPNRLSARSRWFQSKWCARTPLRRWRSRPSCRSSWANMYCSRFRASGFGVEG